jgi:glucose-1-phosphate thymidylyltransferase
VAGKPLLGHVLSSLAAAGLHEIGLVVGHHPEAVKRYVGDGHQWGISATYITQEQPLGLGHAIKQAHSFVGDASFVVYLGDNLLEHGIHDFVDEFRGSDMAASLLLKTVEDPRRYGVAVVDDQGHVVRLVEKPSDPPSSLAVIGVYAFESVIFDAIDAIKPSPRGELEITDAIQHLVGQGATVNTRILEGFWEDAGEPKALLRANRQYLDRSTNDIQGSVDSECLLEGKAVIGIGTRLINSRLIGPVLIGRNCLIENSTIGPHTSIGDGCEIIDGLVSDSLIQDNCRILGLPAGLESSVLGENVQIVGDKRVQCPLRVILGDMAQVRML